MSPIRVAVLTVSDTASSDASADKSGPTIREIFNQDSSKFQCVQDQIVPDEGPSIQRAVKAWVDSGGVDWIVTTGGTGFGVRDCTPEAISVLLEREASGIVHLLLSTSLQKTPFAALSRPVAGTIRNTLIVTLPGSVKAVKENMDALLSNGVVEHAIDLIRGGSGREVHATLAKAGSISSSSGHTHHHHHHHHHNHHPPQPRIPQILSHDPSQAVSTRHRVSPYPLISYDDAMAIIYATISRLPAERRKVDASLKGFVLAEDVYSPSDFPPNATTSVDGYAVTSSTLPGVYKVVTSSTHSLSSPPPEGTIYRINTGAQLPVGTDAVIMVEDTRLVSTHEDGEEKEVETLAQVPPGENVRSPGSDVRKEDLALQKGERITSAGGEIGTLAFVGRKEVEVYKKPVVAILSTGNEIIDLNTSTSLSSESWNSWDTNRPSLQATLEGIGYEVVDLGIVRDEIQSHVSAIQTGLDKADIILTTGGTSMGPSDLLKPVIERNFQGTIHFGRVTLKPGKPTTFATIPLPDGSHKPIFALPGNPASALVTFYVFVLPALRRLGGWPDKLCKLPTVRVELQTPMRLDTRTEFHRVIIRSDEDGLKAFSTGGQRSSRVASLSGANGLVVLPQRQSGLPEMLEKGAKANAIVIGEIQIV
ncbi:molybdenum cofactor biosynthesis protein [Moniliophthora roreri MCA 2997]|uniref:Molybdenum cofactor biosynthesis protein n=1 Tax=Moniliophthora roreri (strain MCA 2997) TaxID=1381753 RepID=V2WMA1_MONRO|nr:molybdenum cofactor biosynthesis protein [Moniliophthora roreri MCA 2997]